MKYKIFKIKSDKKAQWLEWCLVLGTKRRDEAIRTLKEEQNTRETVILVGNYVIYGIEGRRLPMSDCELNRQHRRIFNECLDVVDPAEFANAQKFEVILDLDMSEGQIP